MPLHLGWEEALWRLLLALAAGFLIGLNRGERGKPAGLRTTMLVCVAAAVAMMQANLLLPLAGKASNSFIVMDLMRLPLGILSGMGFIGAGAILRKEDMIVGVTTAATLWFVTVIGLCFGGGQLGLGGAATVIAIGVLWGLGYVEHRLPQERRAVLMVSSEGGGPTEEELRALAEESQCRIERWTVTHRGANASSIRCEMRWRARRKETMPPEWVRRLSLRAGVRGVRWEG